MVTYDGRTPADTGRRAARLSFRATEPGSARLCGTNRESEAGLGRAVQIRTRRPSERHELEGSRACAASRWALDVPGGRGEVAHKKQNRIIMQDQKLSLLTLGRNVSKKAKFCRNARNTPQRAPENPYRDQAAPLN